jgi:hypothetical protein
MPDMCDYSKMSRSQLINVIRAKDEALKYLQRYERQFADLDDLPPPPPEWLEDTKPEPKPEPKPQPDRNSPENLRKLLSQVLTIREARPIRNALRKKFQSHPIAKSICSNGRRKLNERFRSRKQRGYFGLPTPASLKSVESMLTPVQFDKLKKQRGINKGEFHSDRLMRAKMIVAGWEQISSRLYISPDRQDPRNRDFWIEKCADGEKALRKGFHSFYEFNVTRPANLMGERQFRTSVPQ